MSDRLREGSRTIPAKILRPLSSLASFRNGLKSTSTFSGPSNPSNSSTLTFTLKLLSRNCFVLAMIVLSLAFHPLPSSSYFPWSLTKEVHEFCTGVGGVILLLKSGGVITVEPSYLISSRVSVQQCARFLEKEKDCGSTKLPSDGQGDQSVLRHGFGHLSANVRGRPVHRWCDPYRRKRCRSGQHLLGDNFFKCLPDHLLCDQLVQL